MAGEKPKAITTEALQQSQAEYKGKDLYELVEITFTKASKYYKEGQKDLVHPATAELFKAKGLEFTTKKVDRDKMAKEEQKKLADFEKELLQ